MIRHFEICGAGLISALLAIQASAQLVHPASQARYVRNDSMTVTAPDFGHFQADIANAFQMSDIFANSLQAFGSISTNDANRSTRSHYNVVFDLAAPADYTLFGRLSAASATGFAQSSVQFRPIGGADIEFWTVGPFQSGVFALKGSLLPGQYELVLDTLIADSADVSTGSFEGTLTLVPEPESCALLLLAAACLVRGWRACRQ